MITPTHLIVNRSMNKLFISALAVLALVATKSDAQEVKISSWNIAWLGSHEYNERTAKDYALLAKYAKQLDADVIALQEVENEKWAKKVFGNEYDFYFSTKDWVQRVGIAVRKSSGYQVDAIEYKALDVGRVRNGMDVTLSKGDKKLRLLGVHLKSGCFAKPLDKKSVGAMPEKTDKEIRAKEACTKLSNQMAPLEAWIDDRAKEQVPFAVLGDFNRRFVADVQKSYAENQGLWQAIDDEGNERLWTPTMFENSKCWGGYYKDYIDHIILDPRAKSKFVANSFEQLVFEGKYSRQLSNALSDHCPISVTLDL